MMNKDLKLANECAKSVNAETPLGKMALEIYNKFCEEGNDAKDFSAISIDIAEKSFASLPSSQNLLYISNAIFPNGVSALTLFAHSFASLRSLFIIPAENPGRYLLQMVFLQLNLVKEDKQI